MGRAPSTRIRGSPHHVFRRVPLACTASRVPDVSQHPSSVPVTLPSGRHVSWCSKS